MLGAHVVLALVEMMAGHSHHHVKDPGLNYLYIRLFVSGRSGVAFLANSPAIAKKRARQATTHEHPRC